MFEFTFPEISDLEKEIGIPVGFFGGLLKEDSWSFVIKLHAFFEGVISNLLSQSLHKEELRDVFAHIELSNARYGKLVFAQKLNLLDKSSITFIRALSEIRNDLVHDPRNVKFNMKEYVHGLDSNQRKAFRKKFGLQFSDKENDKKEMDLLLDEKPEAVVYLGSMEILYDLYSKKLDCEISYQKIKDSY